MRNLSGAQFKQMTLFEGHKPESNMASAQAWAEKRVGPGAQVHYDPAGTDSYGYAKPHKMSVTVPRKSPFGSDNTYPHTVASLEWDAEPTKRLGGGQIALVHTGQEHQRKGLATGLFNIARSLGSEFDGISYPVHSDVRTSDGQGWSKAVGG
jgi:hypothetical protein